MNREGSSSSHRAPDSRAPRTDRTGPKAWARGWSLSTKFLLTATLVLCVSMAALGSWVNQQITRSVLATNGAAAASFMETFMAPLAQNLTTEGALPDESRAKLDELLIGVANRRSLVSVKMWRLDGTVIYSSETKGLVGQHFVSTDVDYAASGNIKAEFTDMISAESAHEQTLGLSLIEVYAPLRNAKTGEVIAVGEVYENGEALALQLKTSRMRTWGFVFATTVLMIGVLYLIVRRGSQTIARQRSELQQRINDVQSMAAQNETLRKRAEYARLDANEANEELISRVGQELHDGPIQVLSLIMLRIGRLSDPIANREKGGGDVTALSELTTSVIEELRTLSTGLVLPEIRNLDMTEAIRLAVERHENISGSQVRLDLAESGASVDAALKICLYRITQESLSNAMKHAGGIGQKVEMRIVDGVVRLKISDRGGGSRETYPHRGTGLGLRGIRNRAESFGGEVEIDSTDTGTTVVARIPLHQSRSL